MLNSPSISILTFLLTLSLNWSFEYQSRCLRVLGWETSQYSVSELSACLLLQISFFLQASDNLLSLLRLSLSSVSKLQYLTQEHHSAKVPKLGAVLFSIQKLYIVVFSRTKYSEVDFGPAKWIFDQRSGYLGLGLSMLTYADVC